MSRDLEVRHCRVLVAVHQTGGVAAAARALGLAQSTVSETALSPAQLRLFVSPGNPMARAPVGRMELGDRSFLLADPDGAFNGLLRAWFKDTPKRPRFESAGSVDGVKRGVLDSEAIGVLPTY